MFSMNILMALLNTIMAVEETESISNVATVEPVANPLIDGIDKEKSEEKKPRAFLSIDGFKYDDEVRAASTEEQEDMEDSTNEEDSDKEDESEKKCE